MNTIRICWLRGILCFAFFHLLSFGAQAQDLYNPQPCRDDLVLPMPNGANMVFRPVFIGGKGNRSFVYKDLFVGDGFGVDKEEVRSVRVNGSFQISNTRGEQEWGYYLSKHEVTEAQFYAVTAPGKARDSQEPIRNVSEDAVKQFIQQYNRWLFRYELDRLPINKGERGFLRLPNEIEWEFAARGGNTVDADRFAQRHPYTEALNKYEWFSGPTSSHDKVKRIGLRRPNPLLLHDMLGNVSELTLSSHGDGIVARGGNYLTLEHKVRASLRKMLIRTVGIDEPAKQQTIGFRLAIASNASLEEPRVPEYQKLRKDFVELCTIAEEVINSSKTLRRPVKLNCLQKASACREDDFRCLSLQMDEFFKMLKREVGK